MKKILLLAVLLLSQIAVAQKLDDKTKSKITVKFLSAEESYNKGAYDETLQKLEEIQELAKERKSAIMQNLKVKALIGNENFVDAKKELDILYGLNPTTKIMKDIVSYEAKVEDEARKISEKIKTMLAATTHNFNEGYLPIKHNDKRGFIDKNGTIVIPLKYDTASPFSEGLGGVGINGRRGFINKTGSIVIPLKYDYLRAFSEGLGSVILNDKYGFVDKTGTIVIPLKYDDNSSFTNGLAMVQLNGKWGFINKSGTVVIPLKYDYARYFSEGLAAVKLNDKMGFIDKTGTVVIPLKYDRTLFFFRRISIC